MLSNRSIGICKMSLHTYPTSPKGPCVRCAILRCSNCTAQLVDCTLKSSRSWMLFRGTYSYFHGCLKKKLHLTREARVLLYTFLSVSQSLLKTEAQGSFGQQFRAQRMHYIVAFQQHIRINFCMPISVCTWGSIKNISTWHYQKGRRVSLWGYDEEFTQAFPLCLWTVICLGEVGTNNRWSIILHDTFVSIIHKD